MLVLVYNGWSWPFAALSAWCSFIQILIWLSTSPWMQLKQIIKVILCAWLKYCVEIHQCLSMVWAVCIGLYWFLMHNTIHSETLKHCAKRKLNVLLIFIPDRGKSKPTECTWTILPRHDLFTTLKPEQNDHYLCRQHFQMYFPWEEILLFWFIIC